VEDLGGLVLDGLHLHQVRRVLPGSATVVMAMTATTTTTTTTTTKSYETGAI